MPWKILIVDDDDGIADYLRDVLEMGSHSVFRADNGDDGLRQARELKPDAIFLDLNMPGHSGYEVLQHLRADPAIAATKVVVTSAKHYAVDIRQSHELGADLYLTKPYTVEQINKSLEVLLGAGGPA
mgnify:CR=1 FL=1